MMRSQEYNCPRCNSRVVSEHRGPEYEPLHFGTACGADWYAVEGAYIPDGHEPGWNLPSAHTCSLVTSLNDKITTLEDERNDLSSVVDSTNATNQSLYDKLGRARRMLLAAGVTEAMIDAALEDPHG